jgi:hypothetical protein
MGGGGLFGGGGGGTTYNVPQPAAPTPIDYDRMYAAARKYGKLSLQDQSEELRKLYPQMTALQFATADQMAGKMRSAYLSQYQNTLQSEMDAARKPSAIEAELQRQATEELAMGRSLTPEQERAAQQSSRSAFAARGMGTSAGSAAAEILNRDSMAQQRLDQRRQFAFGANQLDLARRQRLLGLSGGYAEADPYRQGMTAAFGLGKSTLDSSTNTVGNAFNNALGSIGSTETFNRNMQGSMYNTWQNNNAAIQAANMTGQAATQAGMMNMIGGLGGGAMSMMSDKRMKKDIEQTGEDGVLGLKTYEFRFKGESKDAPKHAGFMAQEVQKVLPEAVEEVDYKGKKRLAIKPQVIGAALATALASQQEAMFAQGYTVGKGFGK